MTDVSSWSEEKVKRELQKRDWSDFSPSISELRDILATLMLPEDDEDVIPVDHGSFASNAGMTEDDALEAAIKESMSQPPSQVPNVESIPPVTFSLAQVRRPLTRIEVAQKMGISEGELNELWKQRVQGLSRFENLERNRYTQEIQRIASELPSYSEGVIIAVILPHGNRITRIWDPNSDAAGIYIWCAADDKMAKNVIRLGSFVIVKANGEILDPSAKIGEQINSHATLFNAWLL